MIIRTMWALGGIFLVLYIYSLEGAPLTSCPMSCVCSETELFCESFNFLEKLTIIQANSVTKLVINNGTSSTNPKLSNLHNLKTLNLASNKIKQLNSLYFPKSLEYLDLSHNFITTLPLDFSSTLNRLKELRLTGNPISCTCDSISVRESLLQSNVIIAAPVKCHSPENLRGKSWLTVSCVIDLFSEMQGDAPYEGSGFDEVVTQPEIESNNQDKSVEEEFIRVDTATQGTKINITKSIVDDQEGSGNSDSNTPVIEVEDDEKNDDTDIETSISESPVVRVNDLLLNNVKACNFDCSTYAPPQNDTETDALPPPSIFEGVKIVLDDFNILKGISSTTPTTLTKLPVITSAPEINKKTSKNSDAEVLTNHIAQENKGNISEETKESSTSTYIFLGALLVLIIALVVFAVVKKRSANHRSHSPKKTERKAAPVNEVELLSATKPSNGTQEAVPLMNGHTDKEPTKPYEDVELREKPNEAESENANLLVPETKRVTVKASEIPYSTPKTPVLVTRHLNSDGSIVTTPTIHQKV